MSERDYLLAAIERCEKRAKRWVNLCERPGLIPEDIESRLRPEAGSQPRLGTSQVTSLAAAISTSLHV
jgi:hypothetical protein